MVHTKTIFAIAIILIIQAKGNEIVLHGQGSDGSYNEIRKSESSLPGGVSKTVVITRRMLGSPISNLNLISSTLGGIRKPGLTSYPISIQPSLAINSQWNLPSQNIDSNIKHKFTSASQWNLPPQNVDNQWNSGPWNLRPAPEFQWNSPPQNVDNQWNSGPWNLRPAPEFQWNSPSQNVGNQWSLETPWNLNHRPASASQWNLPSQNVENQWSSETPWNVNHRPVSASQWNLPPQNADNRWPSGSSWNLNQQPASSSQWDLPSQSGVNSAWGQNTQSNNLPWNLPSQAGLLGINSQNNANLPSGLISQPSGSGSSGSGNAPWNANEQSPPSGSSQWFSSSSNSDSNPSSQSSLLGQWRNPQQTGSSVSGIFSGSGAGDQQNLLSQIGGNLNYDPQLGGPSASGAKIQEDLFSQFGGSANAGWNSNVGPSASQHGSWVIRRPFRVVPKSIKVQQDSEVNSGPGQDLSQAVNGIPLAAPQTSWGESESSSSPEKRSLDEVEKKSAEGHWLSK